jgi:hypothetical protein
LLNTVLGSLSSGVAASTSSYESIASATGTGSNTVITFSSIPSTYKHLQIRFIARDTSAITNPIGLYIEFNSDTAANYTRHYLTGDGATASAGGNTSASQGGVPDMPKSVASGGMSANIYGVGIIDIIDYASTTKNKTIRAITGTEYNTATTNQQINLFSSVWLNSGSAISTIKLYTTNTTNFATGSTFALYGIKGA